MKYLLAKAAEAFFGLLFAAVPKRQRQQFLAEIEQRHGKSSLIWQEGNFRYNKGGGQSPLIQLINKVDSKLLEPITKE